MQAQSAQQVAVMQPQAAAQALLGGYKVDEQVFYMGQGQTFADGDKLVHGQQGGGDVAGMWRGNTHLAVLFSGNKGHVGLRLTEVRRLHAASTATHTTLWPRPERPSHGCLCVAQRPRSVEGGRGRVAVAASERAAAEPTRERAQMSRHPPPPLPGGYKVGEKLFHAGVSRTFQQNGTVCKLVHGQQGEVTGPATSGYKKGKGVAVLFPCNRGNRVDCYLTEVHRLHTTSAAIPCLRPAHAAHTVLTAGGRTQVSPDAPPPLPGGYTVGEKVFYTGASVSTLSNGDKLVHGQQGEVTGPATNVSVKGKGVKVIFPGNKAWLDCYLTTVRRLHAASAATTRLRPTHATWTAPRAHALTRQPQRRRPSPECKRKRVRQRRRGVWLSLTPFGFGGCAQVSRIPPPALHSTAGDQEEVPVVGERTFAQRDAECRKRAIDLDAESPRKRSRTVAAAMQERVVGARSVCTAAVDKRVRELTSPAIEQWNAGQIDGAELDRRRDEARVKATSEHASLTELDCASFDYREAVAARTKAEAALSASEAVEDAEEAKLEAVLRALERGQPGSSQA